MRENREQMVSPVSDKMRFYPLIEYLTAISKVGLNKRKNKIRLHCIRRTAAEQSSFKEEGLET